MHAEAMPVTPEALRNLLKNGPDDPVYQEMVDHLPLVVGCTREGQAGADRTVSQRVTLAGNLILGATLKMQGETEVFTDQDIIMGMANALGLLFATLVPDEHKEFVAGQIKVCATAENTRDFDERGAFGL